MPAPTPPQRTITVVTTSHQRGYEDYGREMLRSFDTHWPQDVRLRFYHEGFAVDAPPSRVDLFDLREASPELLRFRQPTKQSGGTKPSMVSRVTGAKKRVSASIQISTSLSQVAAAWKIACILCAKRTASQR